MRANMLLAELNLNNLSPWRPIVKKGKSGVLARIGLQSVLSILSGLLQVSQDQGVAHCFKDLAGVDWGRRHVLGKTEEAPTWVRGPKVIHNINGEKAESEIASADSWRYSQPSR